MTSIPEIIFSAGAIAFTIALLPTLRDKNAYIPQSTSILTAVVLTLYVYAFVSLGQLYSAITGSLTAAAWWFIYLQRGELVEQ